MKRPRWLKPRGDGARVARARPPAVSWPLNMAAPRTEIPWEVASEVIGPLLDAAVREMNRHGPFEVDDPEVAHAPRWVTLVGGSFEVMSPAYSNHDLFAADLVAVLRKILKRRGIVFNPGAVRTSKGRTLRSADVVVYLDVTREEFCRETTFTRRVPELIVEVLSEDTEAVDRGMKKREYAEIGVQDYYLFDWKRKTCDAFVLRGGRYEALKSGPRGYRSEFLSATWNPLRVLPASL